MSLRAAFIAFTCVGAASATAGIPLDLTLRPRPQTYTDSCQSYGLALAAASVPGSPLSAATARELRITEVEIRKARDAIAAASNPKKSPYDHTVWKQAIEQVSAGALTMDAKYLTDPEKFFNAVQEATGIAEAETLGTVLSAVMVKTPVLTSVLKVGANDYTSGGGHIVTVMGLSRGNKSPPGLALLNPAVKLANGTSEKVACELDDGIGDTRYTAYASVERTYELKKFGNLGYLLLTVRKK